MAEIYISQAGYLPESVKRAVIPFKAESFCVLDTDGNIRFEGKTSYFGMDETSGDEVSIADLSGFSECGRFYVRTDNGAVSEAFEIGEKVLEKALDAVCKAYYFLRCGCELEERYAGKFVHPPCHTERAVLWEDNDVFLDVKGGWHDAGDYGRYVTAGACALAHLLYGYLLFPNVFERQELNIPESGGKLPDIIAECKTELDWIMKMQRKDGAFYHKVTTAKHAPFVMPQEDIAQLYVLPVSSMATADGAAVCALASRVWRKFDGEYADMLLDAAKRAYSWLKANPAFLPFKNPVGCATGEYGEDSDLDNRYWAAAELFAAAGGEDIRDDVLRLSEGDFSLTALGYASVGGLGSLAYILTGSRDGLYDRIKTAFLDEAAWLRTVSDKSGYGAAMNSGDYYWGSSMVLMKKAMVFAIAHRCFGHGEYRPYAGLQADVLLGVNPLGISYVTGVGSHCCKNPHLRPAYADGIDECIPGMVCGGPNRHPSDTEAKRLIKEGTPPMKCFADRVSCYSLNEVAIYWNSPTAFVLAYLCDDDK